ncbi:NAD(P)/FAD-dependent oxidoreductase [Williamsia sp.]|uniref:NAD(P)/FAD-dependent oxidoreductase n=1 Tax=Williamsia sp. TaxID=1872085 RepID=UPI001A31CEF6|nr:FAD-dependent oxidoreductase [Williamsia sp.]MBJ7290787.1 FAD-dependent oxidoreductase [Williamsia sp.]
MSAGVVIVGAGLGGARLAENLRQAGYSEPITLIGKESQVPYDRPPLSKAVLRGERDLVALKAEEWYADNHIHLLLDTDVQGVDLAAKSVDVGAGESLAFETLVLATGLEPRFLPPSAVQGGSAAAEIDGVHVLRTYDDALELRAAAREGVRAVVVGAGFIGCEAAASLSLLGARVTIVEPAPSALHAALGPTIGARVEKLHTDRGVTVRTGVGVRELVTADGAVTGIELDDGTTLDADLVLLGIGSIPTTALAETIGLELSDRSVGGGIACDARGKTSADGVYALGDVANWSDETGEFGRRVEHWNHVVEQAKIVADAIAGTDKASSTPVVHYFWTDQFDLKIQCLGAPAADDEVHIVDEDGDKFLAYFSRDGILTGVVGAGRAGAVMKMRATVAARTPISELV